LLFLIIKLTYMKSTTKNKSNGKMAGQAPASKSSGSSTAHSPTYLQKFFIDQLKDIYYAENELLKGLTDMKRASTTEELEDAFENHLKQTQRHIQRLEKIFQMIGKKPQGKKCEAMEGLLKEARSIIDETEEGSLTRDAALIIAAQKVEHYEIATYGGLVQLALTMDLNRAADLLEKTLKEEEETDSMLTDIAESYINIEAEQEGDYVWQKEEEQEMEEA
jgi:ferritin-like metal-binding protein YciE